MTKMSTLKTQRHARVCADGQLQSLYSLLKLLPSLCWKRRDSFLDILIFEIFVEKLAHISLLLPPDAGKAMQKQCSLTSCWPVLLPLNLIVLICLCTLYNCVIWDPKRSQDNLVMQLCTVLKILSASHWLHLSSSVQLRVVPKRTPVAETIP